LSVSAIIDGVEREWDRLRNSLETEGKAVMQLKQELRGLTDNVDARSQAYDALVRDHERLREQLRLAQDTSMSCDDELRTIKLREMALIGRIREVHAVATVDAHGTSATSRLLSPSAGESATGYHHHAFDVSSTAAMNPADLLDDIENRLRLTTEMVGTMVGRHEYDTVLSQRDEARCSA
jgi:hypothetical protein